MLFQAAVMTPDQQRALVLLIAGVFILLFFYAISQRQKKLLAGAGGEHLPGNYRDVPHLEPTPTRARAPRTTRAPPSADFTDDVASVSHQARDYSDDFKKIHDELSGLHDDIDDIHVRLENLQSSTKGSARNKLARFLRAAARVADSIDDIMRRLEHDRGIAIAVLESSKDVLGEDMPETKRQQLLTQLKKKVDTLRQYSTNEYPDKMKRLHTLIGRLRKVIDFAERENLDGRSVKPLKDKLQRFEDRLVTLEEFFR